MDDFSFDDKLCGKFGAEQGFGSRVTKREGMKGGDRAVTLTVAEKSLLKKFHQEFPRKSLDEARARGEQADFEVRSFPSGTLETVSINHPKAKGDETRLYFKKGVFHPSPLDFWFLFERSGELWIGSLGESELGHLQTGVSLNLHDGLGANTEVEYQEQLNGKIPKEKTTTSTTFQRDPKVGAEALEASGFVCEMLPEHETFASKRTGQPYLEAHHFFPMMEQRYFPEVTLDVVENICILNPYAHKMVHHATYGDIESHLKKMAEPREEFLKNIGVNVDRVLKSYGGP